MATSDVKLLGARLSAFVNRAVMALKVKSVVYEFIQTNPNEKNELLVKSNPVHKKIPVLIHGDKMICESLIIVQYIDDVWADGPPILPSDPYHRAVARFWGAYIDEKWLPLFRKLGDAQGDDEIREIADKIREGLVLLEGVFVSSSGGKGFFGGDNVGYLDIALGCQVGWLKASGPLFGVQFLDEIKTPGLARWAERLYSDTSPVKDVMLEPGMLSEMFKKMQLSR